MIRLVVDRFTRSNESTNRKDLVTKFKSFDAVNRLFSAGALRRLDNDENLAPTSLGVEYANDSDSTSRAKMSLEIVLHALQSLYDVTPARKRITSEDVLREAVKTYGDVKAEVINRGLYFAQDFPALESYGPESNQQASGKIPDIAWMTISERIVALDAKTAWDDYVLDRKTTLENITEAAQIPVRRNPSAQSESDPLILISHSSKDADLASSLIDLLRAALPLAVKQIICSSVEGYRLPLGVRTDEQLRESVKGVQLLVGLLTPASLSSTYVLFELGARWGADLPMIPLWAGVDASHVQGPIRGVTAATCNSEGQLIQFVDEVGKRLGMGLESASSYIEKARIVKRKADAIVIDREPGADADRERMVFEETVYWKSRNGEREGPYCPHCYEAKNKALHLSPGMTKGWFGCPSCHETFRTREAVV